MIEKVKKYIDDNCLLSPGSKVIVGISGGADSVALLYLLKMLGYKCVAAHCNFHLRGEESDRDETFVTDLTREWNIPLSVIDFDTVAIAKERGISLEMAARDLRYEWFEQLRREWNAEAICIAHHQEDNVETVLLNLIRGTGIQGLTGIKPKNGSIVRPLLGVSKKEIIRFFEENRCHYVTDSSNLEENFVRNKIRLQVLPLLETINPSVTESILETIKNMNEAGKVYCNAINAAMDTVFDKRKGTIDICLLKTFPSPESILFEILKLFGFTKEVIRDVYKAMDAQSGKVFYSSTYRLHKDREFFILSTLPEEDNKEYEITKETKSLTEPIRLQIENKEKEPDFTPQKDKLIATFDADKIQFPLILRKWRSGDRFIPFGMNGFQKLSDYFNNHKFNQIQKENTWVLVSGNDIIWIVGHRTDNRYRIHNDTKNLCIMKLL